MYLPINKSSIHWWVWNNRLYLVPPIIFGDPGKKIGHLNPILIRHLYSFVWPCKWIFLNTTIMGSSIHINEPEVMFQTIYVLKKYMQMSHHLFNWLFIHLAAGSLTCMKFLYVQFSPNIFILQKHFYIKTNKTLKHFPLSQYPVGRSWKKLFTKGDFRPCTASCIFYNKH